VALSAKAKAIFYASENADGWAVNLNKAVAIRLIGFVPDSMLLHFDHDCADEHSGDEHSATEHHDAEHQIEGIDPHFWTDPATVKSILPRLTDTLASLDPANADKYRANAKAFSDKLDALAQRVSAELAPFKGRAVFLFHPSFLYLLRSTGLAYGGAIEIAPGKEPSPKYLSELTAKLRESGTRAVYSEPQLPVAPAKIVSESGNVQVLMLDPIGGAPDRESYEDIILYNLEQLKKGF
jgi:zinc transport system substrate-binding protein